MWVNPQVREDVKQQLSQKWSALTGQQPPEGEADKIAQNQDQQDRPAMARHICAGLWVVDELAMILVEYHDQPKETLMRIVRRLVMEHMFMDQGGDGLCQHDAPSLDSQVSLILDVLKEARQRALDQGHLSDQPTAPLMYG